MRKRFKDLGDQVCNKKPNVPSLPRIYLNIWNENEIRIFSLSVMNNLILLVLKLLPQVMSINLFQSRVAQLLYNSIFVFIFSFHQVQVLYRIVLQTFVCGSKNEKSQDFLWMGTVYSAELYLSETENKYNRFLLILSILVRLGAPIHYNLLAYCKRIPQILSYSIICFD